MRKEHDLFLGSPADPSAPQALPDLVKKACGHALREGFAYGIAAATVVFWAAGKLGVF